MEKRKNIVRRMIVNSSFGLSVMLLSVIGAYYSLGVDGAKYVGMFALIILFPALISRWFVEKEKVEDE